MASSKTSGSDGVPGRAPDAIARGTEAGVSWRELANGDPLAAVLDPGDPTGAKNRLIDAVHKGALGQLLPRLKGKIVLDYGCGTGRLCEWLDLRGAVVTGVDLTPEMVAVTRARVPRVEVRATDGSTLPFATGSFDIVVSAYVLQYYVDQPLIIGELARVLRTGGRIVAIEQVTENPAKTRGGTILAYEQMFREARLRLVEHRRIRLNDSRFIDLVERRPAVSRLPGLPLLVRWEAHRHRNAPLNGTRYADVAFTSIKDW